MLQQKYHSCRLNCSFMWKKIKYEFKFHIKLKIQKFNKI